MQALFLRLGIFFLTETIEMGAAMYAFGKVMRELMAEHNTSQAEISRATGIQKQNISLMCNGKTQYPSIQNCKLIATFFGLTLDELWERIERAECE